MIAGMEEMVVSHHVHDFPNDREEKIREINIQGRNHSLLRLVKNTREKSDEQNHSIIDQEGMPLSLSTNPTEDLSAESERDINLIFI